MRLGCARTDRKAQDKAVVEAARHQVDLSAFYDVFMQLLAQLVCALKVGRYFSQLRHLFIPSRLTDTNLKMVKDWFEGPLSKHIQINPSL